ncbi:MAG: hypothetical protein GEU82_00300 [Luteitalea sp.]|nr:hypothetical protein [Luteitalea sp.]
MTVFLVPAGQGRYELYSEAPEEPASVPDDHAGRFKRWAHSAQVQWHALVDAARRAPHDGGTHGRFARWRDSVICRLAESIAEQRTLWSLRKETGATMRFPSTMAAAGARSVLDQSLARAQRHHGKWLIVDLVLFLASGILFFVPGPNVIAYYLLFRVVGHLNSWRGARQGAQQIVWTLESDANLGELGSLVDVPDAARAPLVAEIASRLNLPRLTAFFRRVTA